jgi:hypothetical protein
MTESDVERDASTDGYAPSRFWVQVSPTYLELVLGSVIFAKIYRERGAALGRLWSSLANGTTSL